MAVCLSLATDMCMFQKDQIKNNAREEGEIPSYIHLISYYFPHPFWARPLIILISYIYAVFKTTYQHYLPTLTTNYPS